MTADHDDPPIESLAEHAIPLDAVDSAAPLDTTGPPAPLDDLSPLADALGDATVVGLGEATHGTREFFTAKHRLVRSLVAEHELDLVAIEAPAVEATAIDDYVTRGEGTADAALERVGWDVWRVEAMVDFLEWLRSANADRPACERVRVVGVDVQSMGGPAAALAGFLRDADPAAYERVSDELETLSAGMYAHGAAIDETVLPVAAAVHGDLAEWFDRVDASTLGCIDREFGRARIALRTLDQAREFGRRGVEADRPEQWGFRDRAMAENVAAALARLDADRCALWTHNHHVKRGPQVNDGYPSPATGEHLGRRFGDGYYALGTELGSGTVRARAVDPDGDVEIEGTTYAERGPVPTRDPLPGSLAAGLSAVGSGFVLDYRGLDADSPAATWLAEERQHHLIGGLYHDDASENYESFASTEAFDGLAFVAESTAASGLD